MANARVARARDLVARFKRIKAAVIVTDNLLDTYFTRRADEIEAFNEDLKETLTVTKDEVVTDIKQVAAKKAPAKRAARKAK
jgi:hypothetical protein